MIKNRLNSSYNHSKTAFSLVKDLMTQTYYGASVLELIFPNNFFLYKNDPVSCITGWFPATFDFCSQNQPENLKMALTTKGEPLSGVCSHSAKSSKKIDLFYHKCLPQEQTVLKKINVIRNYIRIS